VPCADRQLLVVRTARADSHAECLHSTQSFAGEGLHPTKKDARVRFDGKKKTVIDGPFAETKELVCGFSIWQTHFERTT
jgi:hypothetical protein